MRLRSTKGHKIPLFSLFSLKIGIFGQELT